MFSTYKEGFLQKQGKRKVQGYKKRWFVLNGTILKYYSSQDTSESNVLGVIDMARVVSVKASKNVKNGFEISTQIRTYYMSSKISEDSDAWIKVIANAVEEARRLSTCSSTESHTMSDPGNTYDVVGKTSPLSLQKDSSSGYSLFGEKSQPYDPASAYSVPPVRNPVSAPTNPLATYSVVGGDNSQLAASETGASFYSVVGTSGQNLPATNEAVAMAATYDSIPTRVEADPHLKGVEESIYDTIRIPVADEHSPGLRKVPLNDNFSDSGSENEAPNEHGDSTSFKLSSLMSKFSMESLDSIDSLDLTELTDDELHEDETNGDSRLQRINSDNILPPPFIGKTYASEEIKEFIMNRGISTSGVDYEKVSKDFNLKLDQNTDYPAFDALKKFLEVCKLTVNK